MGQYFFTRQLDNVSWLHGVDVTLLLCSLYILDPYYYALCISWTYLHTAVTNLHYVSVKDGTFKLFVGSEGNSRCIF